MTVSGAPRPIRWIGHRSYDAKFVALNRDVLPVVIRAGALADSVPRRDLHISPRHALFLDDMLIPAGLLVNGRSVVQLEHVELLSYFHVELDSHDILLAEGAPAESFIDHDSRMMFQNAAEYLLLHPMPSSTIECAPRVENGEALQRIRRLIAARAGLAADHADDAESHGPLEGCVDVLDHEFVSSWAFDATQPHTPVVLEVLVDGLQAATCLANQFRSDLRKAGKGDGRCAFHCNLPTPLSPEIDHAVTVRRAGAGGNLTATPLTLFADRAHPGPLDGHIDVCNQLTVEGWALDIDWSRPRTWCRSCG